MRAIFTLFTAMLVSSSSGAWTVEKLKGDVTMETKGKKSPAVAKAVLAAKSTVETGSNGRVLLVDEDSEIWLGESTKFNVQKLANRDIGVTGRLEILKGKLRAKIKRPSGPEAYPYEIKTRSVVAGVRGTEFFVAVEPNEEKVCTLEGLVRVSSVRSAGESWDVPAGRGLFVKPNEMPKVRETAANQAKGWIDATTF